MIHEKKTSSNGSIRKKRVLNMAHMSKQVVVTGAGGFIGSHLAKRLKEDGHFVRAVDWKKNEFMPDDEFCDEFLVLDLRNPENAHTACKGMHWVFNLAADMGGMGFIQSNHSRIIHNSTLITLNVVESARCHGVVERFFYSSSACVYPEHFQTAEQAAGLKEADAWPAAPQDAYGLEKLYGEEIVRHYGKDFGFETRIARYHNIYGPQGTWKRRPPRSVARWQRTRRISKYGATGSRLARSHSSTIVSRAP